METLIDNNADGGTNWVTDGTAQSFNTDVVEASKDHLVLVDLWAPWCGPCKQLGPLLEKIVNGSGGAVTLVKIDIDQNPQIAQALRVQSIPAVFAFKNGQPVDGFMGAVPESDIKKFIEKNSDGPIGPTPVEAAMEAGLEALETENMEVALASFAEVLELEPEHVEATAHLARLYLKMGEIEAARNLLEAIPDENKSDATVSAALAALTLAENAANAGDLGPLLEKVDADPEDLDARLELARAQIGAEAYIEGGNQLLEIIRRDKEWNDAIARQELLGLFEVLGPMHDITKELRRSLSSLLFS